MERRDVPTPPGTAAPDDATAIADIDLDHPAETVWRSLTEPDLLATWMGQGSDIEPRVGGDLTVTDPVTGIPRRGTVEGVRPGRRLDVTWWPEDEPDSTSEVSFILTPRPGGTTLTVVETLRPTAAHFQALACASVAATWRLAALRVATAVGAARPAALAGGASR